MKSPVTAVLVGLLILSLSASSLAQAPANSLVNDLRTLVETPAVPGYESDLTAKLTQRLSGFSPRRDNLGNLIITIGSGAPNRLVVTPIDEPGFVISQITSDGYLRLQRLPQGGLSPLWNELHSAQPVLIKARDGHWLNAAVAGLSVHLQPGRQHTPDMGDLENLYVDVGATSAAEVRAAGIDLLDPVALDRTLYEVGANKLSSPAVQNRFGAAALLQLLQNLDRTKLKGTLTIAFVTQQWTGSRGLIRALEEVKPDELLFVGPLFRPAASTSVTQKTGTGVIVSAASSGDVVQELKQMGTQLHVPVESEEAAAILARSYLPQPKLPDRFAQMGIPTAWSTTPAQYIDKRDLAGLVRLLEQYVQGSAHDVAIAAAAPLPSPAVGERPKSAPTNTEVLKRLIEVYGVSDHEAPVAEVIAQLLPPWAKPVKDKSGNLILEWGAQKKGGGLLVVAHQDELGFQVTSITPDGHLALENKGGGWPPFFAGHTILFHTSTGMRPAVIELPAGWDQPKFQWPSEQQFQFVADVGATTADEVAQLNIKVGDSASVPKKYRPLIGTRASARSFDDRMGCAALISAAWKLGPDLGDRQVTFVWSTGEELGLLGASALAQQLAAEGRLPSYVFAIDTFVSSDSPIESKRFADAEVGHGFVVRAVDNSNIVPPDLVNYVLQLAAEEHIPSQFGVTGGGNDGSAFVRFGSTDVAMGWPLRYSHSSAEVIDTKDLDALTNAVITVSKKWSR